MVGIGLAIASLVIMPFLSWAQRSASDAAGPADVQLLDIGRPSTPTQPVAGRNRTSTK